MVAFNTSMPPTRPCHSCNNHPIFQKFKFDEAQNTPDWSVVTMTRYL